MHSVRVNEKATATSHINETWRIAILMRKLLQIIKHTLPCKCNLWIHQRVLLNFWPSGCGCGWQTERERALNCNPPIAGSSFTDSQFMHELLQRNTFPKYQYIHNNFSFLLSFFSSILYWWNFHLSFLRLFSVYADKIVDNILKRICFILWDM